MVRGNVGGGGRVGAGLAAEARRHSRAVEILARVGYAARGVVYATIGILAVQAAFLGGGSVTDPRGALTRIAGQSRVLLVLVAIGLAGYGLWRLVQGVVGRHSGSGDAKAMAKRIGIVASGIVHFGLAFFAVRLLQGDSGDGGGEATTAGVMAWPAGRWLIGIAGVAVIVAGFGELASAWTKRFREKLRLAEMTPDETRIAERTGQFGKAARGIVFLLTGWFLLRAALNHDPSAPQGLDAALAEIATAPFGPWLLGLVALGLIAFAAYSLVMARFRRIAI